MCIRDSIRIQVIPGEGFGHLPGGPAGHGGRGPHTLGPYICLLYTSDAADERSSVDLGGRRIIKKKKQTHLPQGSNTLSQ